MGAGEEDDCSSVPGKGTALFAQDVMQQIVRSREQIRAMPRILSR